MRFSLTIKDTERLLPPDNELAQAAGRGVSNLVKRHLMQRDTSTAPSGDMPKTGYYGEAASSVTTEVNGNVAVVSIPKEGMALHFYGGVIYPGAGKKALAIPKHPATAGKRAEEFDPSRTLLSLVWPKGEKAGTLREKETDEVYYLLVARANIHADPSVLPEDSAMLDAANIAMEALIC